MRAPAVAGGRTRVPGPRPTVSPWVRRVMLVAGAVGLFLGMWTGLVRAGVHDPIGPWAEHGIIMVLGFLGTVIALERAVALQSRWVYVAPALAGASVPWLLVGGPTVVAGIALTCAGLVVVTAYITMLRQQRELHMVVMGIGAVAWVVAAALWTSGWVPARLSPLLAAFLVLTIVGERLELSRLRLPGAASRRRFGLAVAIFVVGVATTPFALDAGLVIGGIGLVAQTAWLVRHDLARVTIRKDGIARFAAACMLSGYFWLATSGLLWMAWGFGVGGVLVPDAALHSLFLGFVMSMVMGHAPIIVPAVIRVTLPYRPILWVPLGLLHVSVLARVGADLAGSAVGRGWTTHGNVVALTAFVVVAVWVVTRPAPSITVRQPTPSRVD